MTEPFAVDTDALQRAGQHFRDLAQRIETASHALQAAVRAQGEPWGDDKSGQQFVAKYGPVRDQLLLAMSDTAGVVSSTADGVETMGKGFARTEEQATEAAQEAQRRVRDAEAPLAPTGSDTSATIGVAAGRPYTRRAETTPALRQRALRSAPAQGLEPTSSFPALERRGQLTEQAQPLQPTLSSRVAPVAPSEPMQSFPAPAAMDVQPSLPAVLAESTEAVPLEPTTSLRAARTVNRPTD